MGDPVIQGFKGSYLDNNYYKIGSYNIICDRCGQKKKAEQCRKEWTGLLTCTNCWDPKHPWNEPLPIAVDGLPVSNARPRPNPVYVSIGEFGASKWGVAYSQFGSTVPDISWSGWDKTWGADVTLSYTPENFPLR